MANEQSLEAVSKILGITPRRMRDLAKDDILPPILANKIDFPTACMKYIAYIKRLAEGGGSLSLTDERTRLTKISADRKDLQLQKEKGELLNVDIVMKLQGGVLQAIRSRILSLPAKLATLSFGSSTIAENESIIRKGVYEVLDEVRDINFSEVSRVGSVSDPASDDGRTKKPKGQRVGRQRKKATA